MEDKISGGDQVVRLGCYHCNKVVVFVDQGRWETKGYAICPNPRCYGVICSGTLKRLAAEKEQQ